MPTNTSSMNDSMMDLVEKYLAGTATPAEKQQVEAWYALFEENEDWLDEGADSREVLDILYQRIEDELGRQADEKIPGKLVGWRKSAVRWPAIAAALLMLVSGAYLFINRRPHPEPKVAAQISHDIPPGGNKAILTLANGQRLILDSAVRGELAKQGGSQVVKTADGKLAYRRGEADAQLVYNTLTTPRGGQYQLTLADGTRVWLNAQSSITYPTAFTGAERVVSITGEVYVEVAQDAARPFHVKVNQLVITVLGTHFNINDYNDEPSVNTTLLEGLVRIDEGDHHQMILPGQNARVDKDGQTKIIAGLDTSEVMAWKNGYFQFNHADLPGVMRQIARWYDVTVEYKGPVPDMKFTGRISRNSNASDILKILEESEVHFTVEGKKIIVR
jgi:ferric-dicitrate binding protein FerR (iron transport regulator)